MIKIIFIRHGESTENVATLKGVAYDKDAILLTKLGEEQATKTGEYLSKTFGKFDMIYSSPIKRCVQTSELIAKEIKYPLKNIVQDDMLIEIGAISNLFDGLSQKDRDEILNKNKKFTNITSKIEKEIDPFEKYKLKIKEAEIFDTYFEVKPNYSDAAKNCKKFLRMLKKTNEKKILVITHGGVIDTFVRELCNINQKVAETYTISIKPYASRKELTGNCCCFYVGLEDGKFHVVIPPNREHLN